MKTEQFYIEDKVRYLGQSKHFKQLPTNKILDKGRVGCGGTSIAIESKDKYVICVPFVPLIDNKVNQYPNERFSGQVFGFYDGVLKRDLDEYLERVEIPKIMVTYDSLGKLSRWINPEEYKLLIDELHILFVDYSFRNRAVRIVLDTYEKFKEFCFMTATPVEPEFTLVELKNIPVVEAIWKNTTLTTIESIKCYGRVIDTVAGIVQDLLDKESEHNAYFFVNSVQYIKDIVASLKLTEENTRVIYSKHNKTNVGIERGHSLDAPKKINFITSTAFEGVDFYDEDGIIYVVSDSAQTQTLVDISTRFQQIVGRIRDSKFKDTIFHIYKETRYSEVSYEEHKEVTEKTIEKTKQFISDVSGKDYADNIETNVLYAQKNGNIFSFDENKVRIDLYNYKVTRSMYSLRVNLEAEYEKYGYAHKLITAMTNRIVERDLQRATFKDVVLAVKDEQKVMFRLNSPMTEVAFKKYSYLEEAIKLLGFEGIEKLNYSVRDVKRAVIKDSDSGQENKILSMLRTKFKLSSGEFIKSAELKAEFSRIYKELGIEKTPKGTDINNYFETKKHSMRDKKTRQTVSGFLLVAPKIILTDTI